MFSFLQGAVSTIRTSIFMIGLLFGKSVVWGGQARDAHGLSWAHCRRGLVAADAVRRRSCCGALLVISPAVLWWSLPLTAGYLLAVPVRGRDRQPALGAFFQRRGMCGIPEDFHAPRR